MTTMLDEYMRNEYIREQERKIRSKELEQCLHPENKPAPETKWTPVFSEKYGFRYHCSKCGAISTVKTKFCYDCGEKMDVGDT